VDLHQGLTREQVREARLRYGKNELAPEPGTPFWKLVLKQFDDLLVKVKMYGNERFYDFACMN
jgi:Ca2+ transporting ATPase